MSKKSRILPMTFLVTALAMLLNASSWAGDDEAKVERAIRVLDGTAFPENNIVGKPIVEVHLSRTAITNEGLRELAGLKRLRILWLDSSQVTDAGVKEIAALASLQELDLSRTNVAGTDLKALSA